MGGRVPSKKGAVAEDHKVLAEHNPDTEDIYEHNVSSPVDVCLYDLVANYNWDDGNRKYTKLKKPCLNTNTLIPKRRIKGKTIFTL